MKVLGGYCAGFGFVEKTQMALSRNNQACARFDMVTINCFLRLDRIHRDLDHRDTRVNSMGLFTERAGPNFLTR